MNKKVSIADIAKSLGVSKTLISLVINGKGDAYGINTETQKKVQAKVKELNYTPNVFARGFRTGKTNTIGLIVSDISNRFYSRIARRVEDYAWSKGYSVIICSTDEKIDKEQKQIKLLQERKVDGLIISTSQTDSSAFNQMTKTYYPHVLIDRTFADSKSAQVTVDNYGGAKTAVQHLLKQGFRDIALLSITPKHISTIHEREKGFEDAMQEANSNIPPEWRIKVPFAEMETAVNNAIIELQKKNRLPEAIFALNNNLTSYCLSSMRKLNLTIPNQIALISFDDMLYFDFTNPSVSSIAQPIEKIGERAFDLLLQQINMKTIAEEQQSVVLPVELIVRESSIKN